MIYRRQISVEFNHCDPAGIVFYPRYFEMTNSVVENFFLDVVQYPYARIAMVEKAGVPTVRIDANFKSPCRLGEKLEFSLQIKRIGRSSVNFWLVCACLQDARMTADLTLVWVTPDGRSAPWPQAIRDPMTAFMNGTAE